MITGPGVKYNAGDTGSLDTSIMYRFGGSTLTNYTNKIYTYINNTLKLMNNSPKIMVGSTLKNIKAIWVGNKEVFGSRNVTDGGLLVNYMYYINGSWKSSLVCESIANAKSYTLYSGDVLYGVYVGNNAVGDRIPTIYFNGKALAEIELSSNSSGYQYIYNNYVVGIYNPYNVTMTNKITHSGGSKGTLATKTVNIPPGVVAFFNMSYCQPSGGSGSGSGSASSSSGLSNCYLTFKIKSNNDTKVTLDFTGANNFQATS